MRHTVVLKLHETGQLAGSGCLSETRARLQLGITGRFCCYAATTNATPRACRARAAALPLIRVSCI
jgi:hypothetical protein